MIRESRVTDGATLRHSRIMNMLRFIQANEGCTATEVQSFLFMNYGLKFKTSLAMLIESCKAGSLKLTQSGEYIISAKFKKYL